MTKEEAMRIAQGLLTDFKCESETMVEFCNVVIKALEQEPCDDAISRQAAIDACLNGWNKDYKEIVEEIRTLPPVTPQPKTGRWISTTDKAEHLVWECDKCSWQQRFNTNYCPDCGANMSEGKK